MSERIQEWIEQLKEAGQNPKKTILQAMRESGREAVGCFPIYTPEEIVHAAGFLPVGLWGGQRRGRLKDRYLQSFCCSVMKANTEQALGGEYYFLKAMLIPVYCDTLKCVLENFKTALPDQNIIAVVYPQNRKIAAGKQFLQEEFQRLQLALERLANRTVAEEELAASFQLYEEYRLLLREFVAEAPKHSRLIDAKTRHLILKAAWFMDKQRYVERLGPLVAALKTLPEENGKARRIILTGLMAEPAEILDIFTANNMIVVADDLAQESRQFRTAARAEGRVWERMVERVADQDGCAFLYDAAKSRGAMLAELVKAHNADAVVYCQMKFCDPEEFDYPIVKKELAAHQIPLLHLELEQQLDSLGQLNTRIQSFAEMLG